MVWYNYRRVPAVVLLKQLDRRRQARAHLPLPRAVPAGLDDLARSAAGRRGTVAAGRRRRRQRRHRRSARALHRHRALAERADRRSDGDDRDVHQGAHAHADRQESSRSASTMRARSWAGSRTDRWRCSRRRATRAATRRSTRSRSTASTPPRAGTCTICIACSGSIIATKDALRGWRSIHITDSDHPYMKHWWVPGLQIGYEHTFIHQFADFLQGLGEGQADAADVPRRPGDRLRDRCGAEIGEDPPVGNDSRGARQGGVCEACEGTP